MTRHFFVPILVILYIVAVLGISSNINDPFLWFDEAGQFWIAKGLNHDSSPYEAAGPVSAVVSNNAAYNADPGGYGILLHFWTKLSNSFLWMRFLSFLFLLATSLLLMYLSYRWTGSWAGGLAMGFVPFFFPTIIRQGFEIRAYSMEYLGVVFGVFALYALRSRLTLPRIFAVSCVLALFLTSRYSTVAVTFVVSLYVMGLLGKAALSKSERLCGAVLYGTPLVLSLASVYVFALRVQNPGIKPLFYLPYLSRDLTILFKPDQNLLYLAFVALLAGLLVWSGFRYNPVLEKHQPALFVAVLSNAMFVALSFVGAYPWAPLSRFGLPYFVATLVCGCALLSEVVHFAYQWSRNATTLVIIGLLMLSGYANRNYGSLRDDTTGIFRCLDSVDLASYKRIYVDRWASPSIRYLFEYGSFVKKWPGIYPSKFQFARAIPHNILILETNDAQFFQAQQKMNDLEGYDLLITPELHNKGANNAWVPLDGCMDWVFVRPP